ncbi:MAG: hypothetical protein NTV21_12140 [Planctomycetota bacterium]|nr:hypothetical protein [Planctomycetota bacterium]
MTDQIEPAQERKRSGVWRLAVAVIAAALAVWGLNYLLVGRPVGRALLSDTRNRGYSLCAHYGYYLNPNVLVLDLRAIDSAAPLDLFRGIFQSAEALHNSGRRFERVALARSGTTVFLMNGEDFSTLGLEFGAGQNPVYLVRTLPEKLLRPDGEAAFGRWQGGLIGVLGEQAEDANDAAQQWASGDDS